MNDEWKEIIQKAMQEEAEMIMEEVNADPALRDVKCPEEVHDRLFAQIREYEEKKMLEQLSDEDRELLRLGKIYKRRRKWSRYAVLIAAVVALLALGTVSMGEEKNVWRFLKQILSGGEQTVSDAGSTEPTHFIDEEEVYAKIEKEYKFAPVKLEYLPETVIFQEAVFFADMQETDLYYGSADEANLIYVIKPNYRESSFATIVEDEKLQEYIMVVNDTSVTVKEYSIVESSSNRWVVSWVYQDVQYTLNITNMEQKEVEQIVNSLRLFK